MSDINNNNAAGSSSSGNNPAPPHEAASSPAIEVTRTRSLEQDQPAAQDADISQESPGKGQSQRVQWTSDVHPSAANQEANNSHDSEETAIDPDTLAKLKESAQGVTEAHRPPAPATTSHAGPIGVANTRSEYFNFEGMDSEMVIPEGETDGLPSAKARKAASRKQKAKPKAFGARLKSLFGDSSGDSQPDSTHDPEKGPAPDQSGDVSSEDEEQDTHVAAAQGQSFSVLGNLMALRDADNSGASTPATNNSSIDLTQTRTEERPRPDLNSAASSPVKEKDVGEANLTEPTATSTSLQTPNSGSEAKPRRNDKSSNSLFSLKGHPAFLDKLGKMFASAAQSALSTPGGVARSVAKNMKTDSGAAKKRRRERKKDMIRAKLAAIVERQQFIMKLTRALMMFGSPSHRLEALITNTGTFLECPLQCVFTPGVMTMSFIDPATRTSETKFIKQGTGLDLRRLPIAQKIYRHTMHGRISVKEASDQLDELMLQGPSWNAWQTVILGMFASAWITPLAFGGGLVDALGAMLLGGVLVAIQMMVSKVESYANIFEIFASAINSFLASALASTDYFCFSAVTSGSVVLILPGFIVLCGSLELTARNISAGSVRMFYAIIYSLLLGFGLSLGSQTWYLFTSIPILGQEASSCAPRSDAAWWLQPAPDIYRILFAPMFMLFLALRNQATFRQKELYLMILIGSAGYCVNYFVTSNDRFSGRADFSSALGCFTVGFLGNLYSRFTNGNGFAVMAPGVLFQLPSGLSASGGLLTYASTSTSDANLQSASQQIGQTLISIAIGITVGLFFASALVNPQSGTTRKQAAFFAF